MSESNPERVVKSVVIDRLDLTAATDCRDESPEGGTEEIIARYAEAMGNGDDFPLPVVFDEFDDGTVLRLADGKKRLLAAKRIGRKDIRAEIRVGGLREAVLHAAGANLTHGVVSSRADKRRAVAALLRVASDLSDREIGKKCGVDHKTVASVRGELTGEIPQSSLRTGADGRTIDVSGIGARPQAVADESYVEVIWAEVMRALKAPFDESDDPDLSDLFDEDEEVEIEPLTPEEEAQLRECKRKVRECDRKIAKHAVSVARSGRAITTIRDRRLYCSKYETFDAYCEARFGDHAKELKIALACHDSLSRSPTGARALAMALSIADEDTIGTATDPQ